MAKIIGIDLGCDRLISMAAAMATDHNFIGALKMLNKNAEIDGNDGDSLTLYAEIYDDMGLHEKCINAWFRFLDYVGDGELTDCYEGLAVNYMNIGNEHYSAYYYNKLLAENGEIGAEERNQILKDFLGGETEPLKFVYPPELADCTDIIDEGIAHMKAGEFDLASDEFLKVDERNEKYATARNYLAMCKIITDRTDEAEQECYNILKVKPDNVQALTTLAAVKTEQGKRGEAVEIARKLLALNPENPEEIYKIATVCCENKMHAEAYELFCKLSGIISCDLMLWFFKAVSAFNCGKYDQSLEAFDNLVTVYPEAVTARYHYDRARSLIEAGRKEELTYFYRLPQEMREENLKTVAAALSLPRKEFEKSVSRERLKECILWCLEEAEGTHEDLKSVAAQAAVKGHIYETARDILLDAFVSDKIKIDVLISLAERNVSDTFGVVICNIFKCVSAWRLRLGSRKKSVFVKAYARLFAHFALLDDDYSEDCANAAENLYERLSADGRLALCKDPNQVAAAIYIEAGINEPGVTAKSVYEFFGVDEKTVLPLLGDI